MLKKTISCAESKYSLGKLEAWLGAEFKVALQVQDVKPKAFSEVSPAEVTQIGPEDSKPPAAHYIYEVDELPYGLKLDPNTGVISGTPTEANIQLVRFVISAKQEGKVVAKESGAFVVHPALIISPSGESSDAKNWLRYGGEVDVIFSVEEAGFDNSDWLWSWGLDSSTGTAKKLLEGLTFSETGILGGKLKNVPADSYDGHTVSLNVVATSRSNQNKSAHSIAHCFVVFQKLSIKVESLHHAIAGKPYSGKIGVAREGATPGKRLKYALKDAGDEVLAWLRINEHTGDLFGTPAELSKAAPNSPATRAKISVSDGGMGKDETPLLDFRVTDLKPLKLDVSGAPLNKVYEGEPFHFKVGVNGREPGEIELKVVSQVPDANVVVSRSGLVRGMGPHPSAEQMQLVLKISAKDEDGAITANGGDEFKFPIARRVTQNMLDDRDIQTIAVGAHHSDFFDCARGFEGGPFNSVIVKPLDPKKGTATVAEGSTTLRFKPGTDVGVISVDFDIKSIYGETRAGVAKFNVVHGILVAEDIQPVKLIPGDQIEVLFTAKALPSEMKILHVLTSVAGQGISILPGTKSDSLTFKADARADVGAETRVHYALVSNDGQITPMRDLRVTVVKAK